MPVRDEAPIEALRRPDRDVMKRLLRWPRLDERARAAEEADARDLRLLVGTPVEVLAAIERVERETGRAIRDAWPSWKRVATAGAPLAPVREALRLRSGRGVRIVELIRPAPGVTLAVDGKLRADTKALFEFLPLQGGEPRIAGELHSGLPYRVVVTDGDQLWRYDGGEVVRFLGPRLVERVGNRFDAGGFGERLPENAIDARLIPEYPTATQPRARYRIEASYESPPADLAKEGERFDDELKAASDGYRRLRDAGTLSPPWLALTR